MLEDLELQQALMIFTSLILSRFKCDKAKPTHILLRIMLGLEANDSFTLLQDEIVPLTNTTVSLHLANRVVVLVAEANLIDPVLACLQSYLANGAVGRQVANLIAFVDARVPRERRRQTT